MAPAETSRRREMGAALAVGRCEGRVESEVGDSIGTPVKLEREVNLGWTMIHEGEWRH